MSASNSGVPVVQLTVSASLTGVRVIISLTDLDQTLVTLERDRLSTSCMLHVCSYFPKEAVHVQQSNLQDQLGLAKCHRSK
jgi:hypothetical protein